MAADDRGVFPSSNDRVHEAKSLDAAGERLQLGVGDPSRVGRIGPQRVDRDVLDRDLRLLLHEQPHRSRGIPHLEQQPSSWFTSRRARLAGDRPKSAPISRTSLANL
jgi:hypothetical protein